MQIDDSIAAFEERVRRTDAHARCFVTLIAQHGKKETARVREHALLDGLDPAAVHANRDLVLSLTGYGAGMTSDALPEVNREPVLGHEVSRL
jgi:hypothetical protein